MKNETKATVLAAFLWGISALIYELVWTRYLSLLLGSSVYAIGVVTACYMVGLAVGSFALGRLADKWENTTTKAVFIGFTGCCVLSPILYEGVALISGLLDGGSFASRVIISFSALFVPTFLIGGMIPILVKKYKRGKSAGVIYGVHTLGSVLGAGATGFVLIKLLGLGKSGVVAGAFVLVGGLLLPTKSSKLEKTEQKTTKKEKRSKTEEISRGKGVMLSVTLVYALSGFTAMAFQMYQTKILTLFFMDSVYDFAIILMVFLSGLTIGNFLSAWLVKKGKHHVLYLGASQMLIAVFTLFSLYVVAQLPYITEGMLEATKLFKQYGAAGWMVGILGKVFFAMLVLLLPTILWGSAFPLVSHICAPKNGQEGKTIGFLIGFNTIGSALGSLLGSFVMVSAFGIRNAILIGGAINLLGGTLLLIAGKPQGEKWWKLCFGGLLAMVAVAFAFLPTWNQFEMSTSFLKPGQDVEGNIEVAYYNEDAYGITSVVNFLPYDEKYLTTNRMFCQNTSGMTGPQDHKRLGYLPLMIHQNAKDVLVVGLGAGVTLNGAAQLGGVNIDCVEISASVAEAATHFKEENGGVLEEETVNLIIDDGRSYVKNTEKKYDAIIGDIFFPMSSGSGSMFSYEYYVSCKEKLKEGGMMMQWLPLHQFSAEELEIVQNTFSLAFDHTYLWFGMLGKDVPVLGLLGTTEELELEFEKLKELYARDDLAVSQMKQAALDDEYMFLSHFVGEQTKENSKETKINTDDKPILEFINPRVTMTYEERGAENLKALAEQKSTVLPYIKGMEEEEKAILKTAEEEILEFIMLYCLQ